MALLMAAQGVAPLACAEDLYVAPGESVVEAIARADNGDKIWISPGRHPVSGLRIDKSLTLTAGPSEGEAVLDAGGSGDVIRVKAPNVVIRGLTIRNSGMSLTDMNAGVFIEEGSEDCRVESNFIDRTAFGVWINGALKPTIRGNRIHGNVEYLSPNRGNGIHMWNVSGAAIEDNEIWGTRDGIYIEVSHRGNIIRRNEMHDLRYGIHYMYSHHNTITNNYTHNVRAGYALMQSDHLNVYGNRSEHDLDYGILMNYVTYSVIRGNTVIDTGRPPSERSGGRDGKAVFLFNSLHNEIHANQFSDSDMGIHLTAGSENNQIYANAFIKNRIQVKYVATREQEWSYQGRGNYWSDYLGWDLDADGIGDRPYEPNDNVDRMLWRYPLAKILMHSPAVQMLRWVQEQFPVLKAPGVRDSHPLMVAPREAG